MLAKFHDIIASYLGREHTNFKPTGLDRILTNTYNKTILAVLFSTDDERDLHRSMKWRHGRRKDFFQGGGNSKRFSQYFFQGVAKNGEICFLPLEIEKNNLFLLVISKSRGHGSPCPPLSDAHAWRNGSNDSVEAVRGKTLLRKL